jgi:hypothetical protein
LAVTSGAKHLGGAFVVSSLAKVGFAAAMCSGAAALAVSPARVPPGGEAAAARAPQVSRATSPALGWRGVDRVAVLCQVSSEVVVDSAAAACTLCDRVKAAAAQGAPIPILAVDRSDAALQAPGTAVLFVQASIAEIAPARLSLILTARAERNGATEETRTFFGAAPRVAPFTSPDDGAAWDAAIAASLSEVLPWLNRADRNDLLLND